VLPHAPPRPPAPIMVQARIGLLLGVALATMLLVGTVLMMSSGLETGESIAADSHRDIPAVHRDPASDGA
jgi:hypothetical protein